MIGRFTAAAILALLIFTVGMSRAEYVIIVMNLNAVSDQPQTGTNPGGATGNPPVGMPPTGMPPTGMPPVTGMPPTGRPMPPVTGGSNEADASDDLPNLIVSVVEVTGLSQVKEKFKKGQINPSVKHRWGGQVYLLSKTSTFEMVPLEGADGKLVRSVRSRFQTMQDEAVKSKANTADMLKLARWALEHGLVDEFAGVMDKLVTTDAGNPSVAAYAKIQKALSAPIPQADKDGKIKISQLEGYRLTETDKHHFGIIHSDNTPEVKSQLDRLEKTFRGFYYWWALNGVVLNLPKEKQVVVLTDKGDDFARLRKQLGGDRVHVDSFFARREALSVFASKRADPSYLALSTRTKPLWSQGFNRAELLTTLKTKGVPADLFKKLPPQQAQFAANEAKLQAIFLQAMEDEWEATSITHKASRQLMFASGLLPNKVYVPEWVQVGLGSFFETPLQSPWGGPGAANSYYLPRFKEAHKAGKYGKSAREALLNIVTDAGFRTRLAPKPGEGEEDFTRRAEAEQRRARAGAWAVMYYLMHRQRDGLQRYFKELANMPRDLELDRKALETCFARAFDCVNPDRTINQGQLTQLAGNWLSFVRDQNIEGEAIHKKIREFYSQMNKPPSTGGTTTTTPPTGGIGVFPMPPAGGVRPGMP